MEQIFGRELIFLLGKMMEHPFMPDLSDKSLEELQDGMAEINNKLTFAYRTQNTALINQLTMFMEGYKKEFSKKMDEVFNKHNINTHIDVQGTKKH